MKQTLAKYLDGRTIGLGIAVILLCTVSILLYGNNKNLRHQSVALQNNYAVLMDSCAIMRGEITTIRLQRDSLQHIANELKNKLHESTQKLQVYAKEQRDKDKSAEALGALLLLNALF